MRNRETFTNEKRGEEERRGEKCVACCEVVRNGGTRCMVLAWHARARPTPCRLVAPLPREGRLFGSVRVYDPAGPQNLRCPLKSHPNTYRSIRGTVQNYGAPCHAQRPRLPLPILSFLAAHLPLCTSTFKFPTDIYIYIFFFHRILSNR